MAVAVVKWQALEQAINSINLLEQHNLLLESLEA